MLKNTFLHLPHFGEKTERRLWARGVLTWDELEDQERANLPLLAAVSHGHGNRDLERSYEALAAGDAGYFAQRLPRSEHYRIALSFPDDTVFLDIETTGLSRFYHEITQIGASKGPIYHYDVARKNSETIFELVENAKCVVTFNGSLFDFPFLKTAFPDLVTPPIHVDLRFLSRRAGMTGGQKAIEQQIGLERSEEISKTTGFQAVELWAEYRRGNASLRKLVTYNHADVEGMKYIFDSAVSRILAGALPANSWPRYQNSAIEPAHWCWMKQRRRPSPLTTDQAIH